MGLLIRRLLSVDRAIMIVLLAIQAATIVHLVRASARDRGEKELLLGRIERHETETAEQLASTAQPAAIAPQGVVDVMQDRAASLVRAQAEMERMLDSMFGSAGHDCDAFFPDSPFAQFDRLHARALRMFDSSFDEFRLAGKSLGPRGQMEYVVVSPAMDMREFDDCYLVAISLPRATRPELSVTLDGRVLFVSGRQGGRQGQAWQFEKRVQLPGPITARAVRATLTNGVLRIVAPKGAEAIAGNTPARIM